MIQNLARSKYFWWKFIPKMECVYRRFQYLWDMEPKNLDDFTVLEEQLRDLNELVNLLNERIEFRKSMILK